ncbi:hypothetical protein K8I61_16185 [bacterium]|nr:hypothetical protein [bacterium]
MKLRAEYNSIRLRLSPKEAEVLAAGIRVDGMVCFGPREADRLTFTADRGGDAPLAIDYVPGKVHVFVSAAECERLANKDGASVSVDHDAGEGTTLRVILERDLHG